MKQPLTSCDLSPGSTCSACFRAHKQRLQIFLCCLIMTGEGGSPVTSDLWSVSHTALLRGPSRAPVLPEQAVFAERGRGRGDGEWQECHCHVCTRLLQLPFVPLFFSPFTHTLSLIFTHCVCLSTSPMHRASCLSAPLHQQAPALLPSSEDRGALKDEKDLKCAGTGGGGG